MPCTCYEILIVCVDVWKRKKVLVTSENGFCSTKYGVCWDKTREYFCSDISLMIYAFECEGLARQRRCMLRLCSDSLIWCVGSLVSLWRPGQCRLAVKVGHGGETTYDKNPWRNSGGEAPMAFRRKIDLIGRHGTEQDETDRLPEKEERETIIINVVVIIKLKKIQLLLLLIWLNKTPKVFDWLIR